MLEYEKSLGAGAASGRGGDCCDLHRSRDSLRKLHPPDHNSFDAALGRASARSPALFLFGIPFTIIALIGVILLIGIVKKNAIMMIDFALSDRAGGGNEQPRSYLSRRDDALPPDHDDNDRRPCSERCLCASPSAKGSELRQPLGVSIVGGLIVSQALTLYTTPIIYLYLDRLGLRLRPSRGARPARPQPRSARAGRLAWNGAGAISSRKSRHFKALRRHFRPTSARSSARRADRSKSSNSFLYPQLRDR